MGAFLTNLASDVTALVQPGAIRGTANAYVNARGIERGFIFFLHKFKYFTSIDSSHGSLASASLASFEK